MSVSNKGPNVDYRLQNLTNALYIDGNDDVVVRTGFAGNIVISGNVNVPGVIQVYSNLGDPVHTHITEVGEANLIALGWSWIPVAGNVTLDAGTNMIGNVKITQMPGITGNVGVSGNVSITQMPGITGNVGVSGNVSITQMPGVAITSLPEVEIKNDTGNPISVSKNTTANSDTNPIFVKGTSDTSFFSPSQSDAFGRLRVSEPFTLFDSQARYYDHRQFANSISGTGSVTHIPSESSFRLSVNTASGDSVIQETVRVFPYQPGKSQLTLNTFCFNTPKTNLRQRVGLFGANDGVFFENDGTYNYFVIRSGSTGVEERVRQDAWNTDRLNPAYTLNPSGYTLNPALTQIMFADVEWLGVGSVRVGFVINGNIIPCHQFNHANQAGNTKVYMTTATLPIRYEITNTGVTASSSNLTQICSTVMSEGGFQLSGIPRSVGHDLGSPITLPNDSSFKPLMSIRLKSANLDSVVLPTNFTIAPLAQSNFKYRVYSRATTTGGSWVSAGTDSSVEYNLAPTAVTTGDIVDESFIIATNQTASASTNVPLSFIYQLERNSLAGVAYEFVIATATTGQNQTVLGSVQWQEVV